MADKGIIDIHCHSVMTHYRNTETNTPVCNEIKKDIWGLVEAITGNEGLRSYNTQSDFGKLIKGGVEAIIISFYAIERKWLLPKINDSNFKIKLVSNVTGFSTSNVSKMDNENPIKYYEDLEGEYHYLLDQIKNDCNGRKFKIATNFTDFENNLNSGDTVSIILSIEGASSLGHNVTKSDLDKKPQHILVDDYNNKYRPNVFKMKSWGPGNNGTHAPLFITLSHHFWNMLGGHCESLPFIFNQKTGKETGLTKAGEKIIEDLLSDKDINGNTNTTRRVLIDIKHMSPKARQQYYQILKDKKTSTGLNIPIIVSHASIGDAPSLNCFIKKTPEFKNFKIKDNFFNTSSLSLNDEDVYQVVDSEGLIGIILHEGRIAAKKAMRKEPYRVKHHKRAIEGYKSEIEQFQLQIQQTNIDAEKVRLIKKINNRLFKIGAAVELIKQAYVCMIMANVFKVVDIIHKRNNADGGKGWNHVCIGSDFDGTINKLDYFGTANEFPDLRQRFLDFLKNPKSLKKFNPNWTPGRLKTLQFGRAPEELTAKFFNKNVHVFLKKYFTEDYLLNGKNP